MYNSQGTLREFDLNWNKKLHQLIQFGAFMLSMSTDIHNLILCAQVLFGAYLFYIFKAITLYLVLFGVGATEFWKFLIEVSGKLWEF